MGVALLSRFPLYKIKRLDLPWHDCAWRPRLAMDSTIKIGGEELCLFNVHIDPHCPLDNQHQQTEAVLAEAEEHDANVADLLTETRCIGRRAQAS